MKMPSVSETGQRVMLRKMEDFRFTASTLGHIVDDDDRAAVRHRVIRHLELAPVKQIDIQWAAFSPQPAKQRTTTRWFCGGQC